MAYLILTHTNNEQLHLLVGTLLSDERNRVYIHTDVKVSTTEEIQFQETSRMRVVPRRVSVTQGGFSAVKAMR